MHQILQRVALPAFQILDVGGLQDEACGIGAHDGGQPRQVAQPGQQEGEAEPQGKQDLFSPEAAGQPEDPGRGQSAQGQGQREEAQGQAALRDRVLNLMC